jgi:hypothetical protein
VITVLARLIDTLLYSLKTGVTRQEQARNRLNSSIKCLLSDSWHRGTAGGPIPGQRAPIAPQAAVELTGERSNGQDGSREAEGI